jgi:hypothetical protein
MPAAPAALIPTGDKMIGEACLTFMAKRAGAEIVEFNVTRSTFRSRRSWPN